eukprot:m.245825 g.245825  ORF g.245825 m.245825 type:complete len:311 (+) comp40256_c0_seq46:1893-2825(+)
MHCLRNWTMISMAYRLTELDRNWSRWIQPNDQLWRPAFVQQSEQWVDILGDHVLKFVIRAVSSDQWQILQLHPNSQRPSHAHATTPDSSPIKAMSLPRSIATLSPSRKSAFTPVASFCPSPGALLTQEDWQSTSSLDSIKSCFSQTDQDAELMASLESSSEVSISERFLTRSSAPSAVSSSSGILTFSSSLWSRQKTPQFNRRTLTPHRTPPFANPIPSSVTFGDESALRMLTAASAAAGQARRAHSVTFVQPDFGEGEAMLEASESMEVITEGTFSPIRSELLSRLPYLPILNSDPESLREILGVLLRK